MKPTKQDGDTTQTPTGTPSPSDTTPAGTTQDANDPLPSGGNGQEPSGTEDTPGAASSDQPKSMAEAIEQAFRAGETPAATKDDAKADDPDADAAKPDEQNPGTAEAKPDTDTDTPDELSEDPTDEELASYRPGARKRVKSLLAQRHAARQEAQALKPDAESYRQVRAVMQRSSLDDREMADLLLAGADLKSGDPQRLKAFIDRVNPLIQMAREAIGEAVPADLQPKVDTGEVTEEVARQMARSRHEANVAKAQAQRAEAQARTVTDTVSRGQIAQAIQTWTTRTQATDPDFARKQDVMTLAAQSIVAKRGHPRTAAEAETMCQEAYAEATRILKAQQPAKAQTRPTPQPGTSPNRPGIKAQPTSLADIVNGVLTA